MLRSSLAFCFLAVTPLALTSCSNGPEMGRLMRENDSLKRDSRRQAREIAERDAAVASLRAQIDNLHTWSGERPADLFAATSIEIASLSGGADYDGRPGDDGITVYLRPKDADGDVVKVPGHIEVQLLDNAVLKKPRVIGSYVFEVDKLRETWHGRFMTNHYTLKCPFSPDQELPASRRLLVTVKFTDFLTGAELTATQEVEFQHIEP